VRCIIVICALRFLLFVTNIKLNNLEISSALILGCTNQPDCFLLSNVRKQSCLLQYVELLQLIDKKNRMHEYLIRQMTDRGFFYEVYSAAGGHCETDTPLIVEFLPSSLLI